MQYGTRKRTNSRASIAHDRQMSWEETPDGSSALQAGGLDETISVGERKRFPNRNPAIVPYETVGHQQRQQRGICEVTEV